jgi:hypothetical protein
MRTLKTPDGSGDGTDFFRKAPPGIPRGDVNALNKTNFKVPASNISNSNFGTITSSFPARQVQLAAKFVF